MSGLSQRAPELLDTARRVETPEGVELALDVAGPFPRALAWMFDMLVRTAISAAFAFVFSLLGVFGTGLILITQFVLMFFYPVLFEVFNGGRTPGKSVLGLTVVQFDGAPVGWSQSVTRNFLRFADFLPLFYGIGLVSLFLTRDFQRLGDLAAGTFVIHGERAGRARRLPAAAPRAPGLRLHRDERRTVDSFAARLASLSDERAVELANLAEPLTGSEGSDGVERLVGIARWLRGER